MLWFYVGIKRYTTFVKNISEIILLWFYVGIKRYTTISFSRHLFLSCGFM